MSVAMPHKAIKFVAQASGDPKRDILKTVGDLSGVDVMGEMVLIGIYIRPEKTAGGIIRPDSNVEEDVYQGKAGLVLKWGPNAFRDETGEFYEQNAPLGSWCVFKVGDAWSLNINGYPCRLVRDTSIKMTVKDPNIVF